MNSWGPGHKSRKEKSRIRGHNYRILETIKLQTPTFVVKRENATPQVKLSSYTAVATNGKYRHCWPISWHQARRPTQCTIKFPNSWNRCKTSSEPSRQTSPIISSFYINPARPNGKCSNIVKWGAYLTKILHLTAGFCPSRLKPPVMVLMLKSQG